MKFVSSKLVAAGAVALSLGLGSMPAGATDFINILTGGTSGVYYPLGVALSKIYSENMKNVKVQVQSTKASVENLNLLQQGRGEIAFALGDSVKSAWEGDKEAGFPKKLDKLRAIAAIYPNYVQIVASKSSGIKTFEDLKGHSLSVGAPKSGTELNARRIFDAMGMSYKDLSKTEYLSFGESVELIKNRQLDATLQSAGLGVASIKDLASSVPIQVVAVPKSVADKLGAPFIAADIPAGTYERPGRGSADAGDHQHPRHARRRFRRGGLPDDEAALRASAGHGRGTFGRQGDQPREGRKRPADPAASGRHPLLQGKGPHQVGSRTSRGRDHRIGAAADD